MLMSGIRSLGWIGVWAVLVMLPVWGCTPGDPGPGNDNAAANDNTAANDNAAANDNSAANDNTATNDNTPANDNTVGNDNAANNDNESENDNAGANDNGESNDNDSENENDNTASNDNTPSNDNGGGGGGGGGGNDNSGGGDGEFGVEIDIPNEGANHIPVGTQATYLTNPPASGPHWSQLLFAPVPPGVFTDFLQEEQWVHNLEHGYVVVLYQCEESGDGCDADLQDELRVIYNELPESETFGTVKFVATPYNGLPGEVMCIAWDVQLNLETVDADRITQFYEDYLDQGPELAP